MRRDDVDDHEVHLVLQGRIVAAWAASLELETRELLGAGFLVALDLADVVFIDRAGREALARLGRLGVRILGCSPLMAAMLEQEGIEVPPEPLNDRSDHHGPPTDPPSGGEDSIRRSRR